MAVVFEKVNDRTCVMHVPQRRTGDVDRDKTISVQIDGSAFSRMTIGEARDLARALEAVATKALEREADIQIGGSYAGDDRRDNRSPTA